jgi:hypothetical protein
MLEVHPLHEKIHGFRDFLVHLFTITIGLLIALGLEALVEQRHHEHLRMEADDNLRHEIQDNRKRVSDIRGAIGREQQNLVRALEYIQARNSHRPYDIGGISLGYTWATLKDASWSTASATGALGFMDYSHVQKYADAYQLQAEFESLQRQTLGNYLTLHSYVAYGFDPTKFPASEAAAAEPEVRLTLAHIDAMNEIGAVLDKAYQAALQ